ncbi:hypothetical protein N431DRAFT_342019 [Stipitochalara longipes BDJ]|nr:hypothetical protein N431DRAFT_342019 [Stipitochalara longipes BDJ]
MGKDADRDREDRELFKRLKVVFRGRSSEWPLHHLKTCQKISILGSQRYSTYCSDDDGSKFWKQETKDRAQRLVDTVSRLTRNQSSEMQWRLDIEKIVFKRFESGIKCPEPTCGKRLWRSEIEAEPETSNNFTRSLQNRRRERVTCSCSADVRLKHQGKIGLNRIFDYRADELIIQGGEAHFELRPRKPDRVHGLQQTKFFTQAIQAITSNIQIRTMEAATAGGLNETLTAFQFTPFEERARPLIFPHLISEAKTERGDSFEACERQTAFPIWTLLKLQEDLQIRAGQRLEEQGGPFVWFFANRGEEWRLYGCFTDIEDDDIDQSTSFILQDLWTGRLDSQDGALQILLLIDYIFDWTRDFYRDGIARLLKRVVDKTAGKNIDEIESIDLGTDFSSVNLGVADWQDHMDLDPPSLEFSLEPSPMPVTLPRTPYLHQEESQKWQNIDTVTGVFRDASILETYFKYIHFKNEVFSTLLAPFVTSNIPEERLIQLVLATVGAFLSHAVMISDDVLGQLEKHWTGHQRPEIEANAGPALRHAIIVYYTHISEKWQLKRAIACIVLENDVFRNMQEHAGRSTSSATGYSAQLREVTSHDVTALVQHLRGQSTKNNLIAAIEARSVFLVKEASGGPGFVTRPSPPFEIPALFQILGFVSSDGHRGSIEHIIRFSSNVDYQRINPTDAKPTLTPPYKIYPLLSSSSVQMSRIKSVLVYCNYVKEAKEFGGPEWCLFCLEPTEVPSLELQFKLLTNLWERDGFYYTTCFLSRAARTRNWREYNDWMPDNPDVKEALAQWKAMLEDLYTIKYVASLAESQCLALSGSIKLSMAGRKRKKELGAVGSGLKSWDIFRVKKELLNRISE